MRFFRSQRVDKRVRSAAIFLAVVLAYFLLRAIPPVGRLFSHVEHGLLVAGTGVGSVVQRVFSSEATISAQLSTCRENLQTVTSREAVLRQELRNVTELEALLGYVSESGAEAIAARITNRSLPEAGTVTINKGTNDGIQNGSAVIVGDGQLLGTVVAVDVSSATVRLVHERQSKVPAAIWGRTRTIGLVEGQNGSVLHMEFIPTDATMNEGDLVVTSGLDSALPPNIVIGLVTTVLREDTAPFLEALIEPLYDAREWTNVLVIAAQ